MCTAFDAASQPSDYVQEYFKTQNDSLGVNCFGGGST